MRWEPRELAVLVLAGVLTGAVPSASAAPDEAANPAPIASPGRDRRSVADDAARGDGTGRAVRDDATGDDALDGRAHETGPTGNDTGTRGTDAGARGAAH